MDYIHRTECGEKKFSRRFSFCTSLSLPHCSHPNPSQSAELPLWSPFQPHVANFEEQKGNSWQKILSGHTKIIEPSLFLVSFHLKRRSLFSNHFPSWPAFVKSIIQRQKFFEIPKSSVLLSPTIDDKESSREKRNSSDTFPSSHTYLQIRAYF